MRRLVRATALSLCILTGSAAAAFASADYPNKIIRFLVPYGGGSNADLTARVIADHISPALGQRIVIDNKPGASGTIALGELARSAPDGYTIGIGTGSMVTAALLSKTVPFDPVKDFAPLSLIVNVPLVLTVAPVLPAKSVAELVAYGQANPGKISYGSDGVGSATHLAVEMFRQAANIDMVHVPYRGGNAWSADLISGRIQMVIAGTGIPLALEKEEKVRILAIAGPNRIPLLPDRPTIAESGYPGFDSSSWFAALAPKGTPSAIAQRLSDEIRAAAAKPEVAQRLTAAGFEMVGSTPEALTKTIVGDLKKYAEVIRRANITVD